MMNHRLKSTQNKHFHLHVIPRYDKNARNDPARVKPNKRFPKESGERLYRTLKRIMSEMKEPPAMRRSERRLTKPAN